MSNETRYPWKDAPEWAMWAATDDDGRRFFFRYAPIRFDGKWLVDQPLSDEFSDDEPEPCPDWRDSLEPRPALIAPAVGVTDAEVEAAMELERLSLVPVTIAVRDLPGRTIKPGALALNGRRFVLEVLWQMDPDERYPGEYALGPVSPEDRAVFGGAGMYWIASGDVQIDGENGDGRG